MDSRRDIEWMRPKYCPPETKNQVSSGKYLGAYVATGIREFSNFQKMLEIMLRLVSGNFWKMLGLMFHL